MASRCLLTWRLDLHCRWVDELASADDGAPGNSLVAVPPSNALVAIFETPHGSGKGKARETEDFDGQVKIGLVSVIPSTGDVTWDDFIGVSVVLCLVVRQVADLRFAERRAC